MTEQDAGLLEQAATLLEAMSEDERSLGNDSRAAAAECSAHGVRRLASMFSQEIQMTEANVTPSQYWLITYQSKESDGSRPYFANVAINTSPAEWLLDRLSERASLKRETTLMSAVPVSQDEFYRLADHL